MNLSILLFGFLVLSLSLDGTRAQSQDSLAGMECSDEFCQGETRSIDEVTQYCKNNGFEVAPIVNFCRDRPQNGLYSFKCCRRTRQNNQLDILNEIDDNPSARREQLRNHFRQFPRTQRQQFPSFSQPQQQLLLVVPQQQQPQQQRFSNNFPIFTQPQQQQQFSNNFPIFTQPQQQQISNRFPIFTQPQQQQLPNNFQPTPQNQRRQRQRQRNFPRNRAIPQQSFQPVVILPQGQSSQFQSPIPTNTFGKK